MDSFFHSKKTFLDGKVHRIIDRDDYIYFILCFPRKECSEITYRINSLVNDGFEFLVEYGKPVQGYRIIGKGYSSIAVIAYNKYYGYGLLKIRRLDSRRSSLEYEGMIMDYLDKTGYVPQIFLWRKDYIFMEYLENCVDLVHKITEYLLENKNKELRYIMRKTLSALYLIDFLGIDHGELNRPYNHIYWCNGIVKIIDWESSSYGRKTHNLSSFLSYILYRYMYRDKLIRTMERSVDIDIIRSQLKAYKKKVSIKTVSRIIRLLVQT